MNSKIIKHYKKEGKQTLVTTKYTWWGDESWTAFCGPAAAAVEGLSVER
jgi:hypothetical protein